MLLCCSASFTFCCAINAGISFTDANLIISFPDTYQYIDAAILKHSYNFPNPSVLTMPTDNLFLHFRKRKFILLLFLFDLLYYVLKSNAFHTMSYFIVNLF